MQLRSLGAGLAVVAVMLSAGCSCFHHCRPSCASPCPCAVPACPPAPAPCCPPAGAVAPAPVQSYSVPVPAAPGGCCH
jgi:hypothetical protein